MASNPPLNVMEDQTDEDFFDKLVDDDFGHTNSGSVAPNFAEGSDSDEAKAFANLSIDDNVAAPGFDGKHETAPAQDDLELTNTLDSSNSIASQKAIDSNYDGNGSEDVVSSQSHDLMKSGVKEIGWSSFYADTSGHGFGSYSDFFNGLGDSSGFSGNIDESGAVKENVIAGGLEKSITYEQWQGGAQVYGASMDGNVSEQDVYSNQDWSSMYPGWKYDDKTGQWYQITNYDANFNTSSGNEWAAVSDAKAEVSYLQNTSQSAVGTVAESNTYESVSNWNQVPQESNNGYPAHMVFDPQYPGWYYDQIVQEWRTLESYTSSVESTIGQAYDQQSQSAFDSSGSYSKNGSSIPNNIYGEYGHADKYVSQGYNNQGQQDSWSQPYASYTEQDLNVWQPKTVTKSDAIPNIGAAKQSLNSYVSDVSMSNSVDQHKSFSSMGTVPSYEKGDGEHVEANDFTGSQGVLHGGNFSQQFNQGNLMPNGPTNFSNNYFGSQKQVNLSQQSFQTNQQYSYSPSIGRSSAGRPPHALVTFGFGGKLIVMKNSNPLGSSTFGKQEPAGCSISVLNLVEVVLGNGDNASSIGVDSRNYFRALCQQSFPGPLVGGNLGTKELNKWIDERIANCELPEMDHRKGEILRLLLSLLKIACQHYGKLRSSLGTDTSVKESETPESAVAKLFASAKRSSGQFSEYGVLSHCLQNLPSEGQLRATASEVQSLLVSGRKKEALQCAQEGQLWGPALVLASQLGDQFYVDTVKQMAVHQLVSGSPLRTLCLLIAGTPADVFAVDSIVGSVIPGAVHMTPQSVQLGANGMLDDWEENLAVITANRTKDDDLVIIHLGDCLWRDRSEIIAAHICYIVAEANFEPYSDSARLCLLGANHLKHPRTYTSPEAIQRTELYEYSKVLGNSQYILLPFQPYKLVYAYMLAEVGKVSDSLKYCQALLKSLKTGRAAEVETWKQLVSSLEERIRTHQQGGYASNLAPGKLVGKLLNFFDSTAHRVVGGLPPPAPSGLHGSMHSNEHYEHAMAHRVSASQSTMAMSSLMPSASMEPISEWAADGNKMTVQNRSVSEPDFSRNPRKVDPSKEGISSNAQGKASGSVGGSRFGRFGFGTQLLQKTVGLVLRPRNDRQAKLGEKNKFYYDEKLKRWVEEGAEPPAEEAALAPPPTTGIFQNGMSDYNLKSALKHDASPSGQGPTLQSSTSSEYTSGTPIPTSSSQTPPIPTSSSQTPPIPTSSNQFSARGRMGVRARYVDTFNKAGGTSTNLFQSPSLASVKPPVATNHKFFVPAPVPPGDNSIESSTEDRQIDDASKENPSKPALEESFPSSTSVSSMTMQRFPSMGNITGREDDGNASHVYNSRRTASWSGSFNDSLSAPRSSEAKEAKTLGETLGMPPSSFTPTVPPTTRIPINRGNSGDDLHEVEL